MTLESIVKHVLHGHPLSEGRLRSAYDPPTIRLAPTVYAHVSCSKLTCMIRATTYCMR